MALIVEDGTGKPDANSYLSVADGDTYFSTRLNSSKWTAATTQNKEAALVMASKAIDATMRFHGFKRESNQALQWPRYECPDQDRTDGVALSAQNNFGSVFGFYIESNVIPPRLKDATAELAIAFLTSDRFTDPQGEGVQRLEIFEALKVTFDKLDRQPLLPQFVQQLLAKLGEYVDRGAGVAKLVRV